MGVSIVDWVNKVFSDPANFDISGFLVSPADPEIQYALGHLSDKDRKNLKKLGYEFKWFNAEMTEGIIFYWVIEKPRKVFFTRRIYFKSPASIDTSSGKKGAE